MSSLKVVVYDNPDQVRTLQAAWDRLLREIPGYSASLDFEFAMCGWETLPEGRDAKLAVVTVWRDAALVCVWPMYTRREGLLRVAYHLGSGDMHEYAGPLVQDDETTAEVVGAALEAVKGLADVARIYNIRVPSRVADVLGADPTFKRRGSAVCPVVSLRGIPDWETWSKTISKKMRTALRYERRRLGAMGRLEFREMAGPHDSVRCMDWIYARKREWLVAKNIRKSFILDPQNQEFFTKLAARPLRPDGKSYDVQTYALTLDDKIIAACICLNSGDRLEFHTTTFDPAYSAHSPGSLMIEDCVNLAIQRGVDFDFRIAQQSYKERWSDRLDRYDSFMFACTPLGVVAIRIEMVRRWVHSLRVKYGPRIKALLKRRPVPTTAPAAGD
ncbi:MAG TPA: GNAT family N-acetyltransferase [Phenylobacterium sp.]|nr:GNAT family N-acetyltransferase [Phenylobacterium sp.]